MGFIEFFKGMFFKVDFFREHVEDALANLLEKIGKLHIRIEANRPTWVHMDTGSKYLNNYVWGLFNP